MEFFQEHWNYMLLFVLSHLAITLNVGVINHHSLRSHKTSLTPPLCIKVYAPSQESER